MNNLTLYKWSQGSASALDFLLLILHPINIKRYGLQLITYLEKQTNLRGQELANWFNITCENDLDNALKLAK